MTRSSKVYSIGKYNIESLGLSITRYWSVYMTLNGAGCPIRLFRTKKEATEFKKELDKEMEEQYKLSAWRNEEPLY